MQDTGKRKGSKSGDRWPNSGHRGSNFRTRGLHDGGAQIQNTERRRGSISGRTARCQAHGPKFRDAGTSSQDAGAQFQDTGRTRTRGHRGSNRWLPVGRPDSEKAGRRVCGAWQREGASEYKVSTGRGTLRSTFSPTSPFTSATPLDRTLANLFRELPPTAYVAIYGTGIMGP